LTIANFTARDIAATSVAFALLGLFLVIPGYVVGALLDVFGFDRRSLPGLLADDFQGTSPKGARFRKADELKDEKGARTAHACGLDEAKVHFFGDSVAVVYGREHAVGKDNSQPSIKVCQIWTDTWLKRGGTWQIIASHDNRVECK
jgi:Domain of unknown function (DUF4440)